MYGMYVWYCMYGRCVVIMFHMYGMCGMHDRRKFRSQTSDNMDR